MSIYGLMETKFYYGSIWLKTATAWQLLVNISSNKSHEYLSNGLRADNRSEADRGRQENTFHFYFIKNT
jgi:hypothetical protein